MKVWIYLNIIKKITPIKKIEMANINKNIDITKPINLILRKIKPSYFYIILLITINIYQYLIND